MDCGRYYGRSKSGFDSEIWGDVDQLMQAFRRPVYSSVILKLNDAATFPQLKSRVENDPRLTLEAKRESVFYAEQSSVVKFHSLPGMILSIFFRGGDYRRNDHHVRLRANRATKSVLCAHWVFDA